MTLVCEILRVKDRVGGGLRRRPHNISFFVDGRRNQSKRRTFFQGEAQTNVRTTPDVEKKEGRAPRLSCSLSRSYVPCVNSVRFSAARIRVQDGGHDEVLQTGPISCQPPGVYICLGTGSRRLTRPPCHPQTDEPRR